MATTETLALLDKLQRNQITMENAVLATRKAVGEVAAATAKHQGGWQRWDDRETEDVAMAAVMCYYSERGVNACHVLMLKEIYQPTGKCDFSFAHVIAVGGF